MRTVRGKVNVGVAVGGWVVRVVHACGSIMCKVLTDNFALMSVILH